MSWLPAAFFTAALVYASVGFGGGSTYTALLGLSGIGHQLIPVVSLACNIVVVTGGTVRFWRAGEVNWRSLWPLLIVSAPLAFVGGLVPLKQWLFYLILGTSLLVSCLALLIQPDRLPARRFSTPWLATLSGGIGLLAGLSGIGGGIFMAPVLHLIRWDSGRRIAAFASVFILVNSIAGVIGQLVKSGPDLMSQAISEFWPLLLAVLVGGQIGSHLGLKWFSPRLLRTATAVLVGYAAIRLIGQGWSMRV